MNPYLRLLLATVALLAVAAHVPAASAAPARPPADRLLAVDPEGVLRWQDDKSEVALFGVNYYPPCSIDYANLKKFGADIEGAIRQDVAHFVRMGLDALRLHVFDREISDAQGHLIDNEHARLLDFLVDHARKNGIYTVLTPIAWWPVPGKTDGFSDRYPMADMITKPEAIEAQRTYLREFLSRRNRYTGKTYAEDPAVPAIELINEPIPAPGVTDDQVVSYIDRLIEAVRAAGCRKPVFYNGWGGRLAAVGRSRADGCTFGWYPTGLVAGHGLAGDYFGRVDDYPDMRTPSLRGKAKIVYEFDAADVPGGHLYAAMARGLRSGGAQIATQFQYDATPLAPTNVNWQTHYLNLLHAPHRAVGFAIAAEAFHALPRLKTYGTHPASDRFGEFRVSHEEQLAERAGRTCFLYCNDTKTVPPAPSELERVAGCGSSPVVQYEGTGAYFLDRQVSGVWFLEVFPDAIWVADPFGPPSLEREVSRLYGRERAMTVRLPDLGETFVFERMSGGPSSKSRAAVGRMVVTPGTYILARDESRWPPVDYPKNAPLPASPDLPTAVRHEPESAAIEGDALVLRATVAALDVEAVKLHLRPAGRGAARAVAMKPTGPYEYTATIDGGQVTPGTMTYCISVRRKGAEQVFPRPEAGGVEERLKAVEPVELVRFGSDAVPPQPALGGAPGMTAEARIVAGSQPGRSALRVTATGFGPPPSAAGLRFPVAAPREAARSCAVLVVRARRTERATSAFEIGLVQSDGRAYGAGVPLSETLSEIRLPLDRLTPLWGTPEGRPRPELVKEVSLIFGSWLFPKAADAAHGFVVERIALEQDPPVWSVPVYGRTAAVPLLTGRIPCRCAQNWKPHELGGVSGSAPGVAAWRFSVKSFEGGDSRSLQVDLAPVVERWRAVLGDCRTLRLRARAGEASTTAMEVVLSETDGTPWGCATTLATSWQDVRVPLKDLKHFAHWSVSPPGRGGAGDACRLDRLSTLTITFGAWLYPGYENEPHTLEIEFVGLDR
jgi:hypothetical protein